MMLRRRIFQKQRQKYFEFTAGADGFVGKHAVEIKPGDYVTIEWDNTRYMDTPTPNVNQTAFSICNDTGYYAETSDCGLSGSYPICSPSSYNTNIFQLGTHSFIAGPTAYNIFIGYWNINTINRNYLLYGDYVKVYIN